MALHGIYLFRRQDHGCYPIWQARRRPWRSFNTRRLNAFGRTLLTRPFFTPQGITMPVTPRRPASVLAFFPTAGTESPEPQYSRRSISISTMAPLHRSSQLPSCPPPRQILPQYTRFIPQFHSFASPVCSFSRLVFPRLSLFVTRFHSLCLFVMF